MNETYRKVPLSRLPYELREKLCEMLRDGATSTDVIAVLDAQNLPGYNPQNISNFRTGAYTKWEKEQTRLDAIRDRYENTRRQIEAGGLSVLDEAIYDVTCSLVDADLSPDVTARAVAALKQAVTGAGRLDVYRRRAELAEEALQLERQKYEDVRARASKAEDAENVAADQALTQEEKDLRIREIFGL